MPFHECVYIQCNRQSHSILRRAIIIIPDDALNTILTHVSGQKELEKLAHQQNYHRIGDDGNERRAIDIIAIIGQSGEEIVKWQDQWFAQPVHPLCKQAGLDCKERQQKAGREQYQSHQQSQRQQLIDLVNHGGNKQAHTAQTAFPPGFAQQQLVGGQGCGHRWKHRLSIFTVQTKVVRPASSPPLIKLYMLHGFLSHFFSQDSNILLKKTHFRGFF